MEPHQHIIVSGLIRSGTTWVGRVLERCEDTIYIHEPLNPDSQWSAAFPLPTSHFYLNPGHHGVYALGFQRLLELQPEFKGRWREPVAHDCKRYIREARTRWHQQDLRCIIKDPTALFSLEWLASYFDIQPVIVLRHPIAVSQSILRQGWSQGYNANFLTNQPQLVEDFYAGAGERDRALLESASWEQYTPVQKALNFVRLLYLAIVRNEQRHPDWTWLCHSRLQRDPLGEFSQLCRQLNLVMTEEQEKMLAKPGSGRYKPTLAHQKDLASMPEHNFLDSDMEGVDWRTLHDEYFSDIHGALSGRVDWPE